jgi:hypothetical protein
MLRHREWTEYNTVTVTSMAWVRTVTKYSLIGKTGARQINELQIQ